MFGRLRDPHGRPSLLMVGLALIILGLLAPALPLGGLGALAMLALWIAGAVCVGLWYRGERAARYDLSRLFDAPPAGEDQPYEDTVPEAEESAPYCGWCDEAYPPGTYRCGHCGRPLG